LIAMAMFATFAGTSCGQSIADTYSFSAAIRSAGIHGLAHFNYVPPRADSSGWLAFPSRVDVRAFRTAPTVTRRGDTIIWVADSIYTSVDGNRTAFQNSITLVVDSARQELTSIGVSLISNEFQQTYQTDRTRTYTFVGTFQYRLTDTALTVSLTGSELRSAIRKIDYSDRTTALLQGQFSATFITGFDTVVIDDTARLTITLAKLRPASVAETVADRELALFPNPADRFVQVEATDARLFDLTGRTLNVPVALLNERTLRLDLSSLASGTYLLESGGKRRLVTVQHR
jgi:hypothetical protein